VETLREFRRHKGWSQKDLADESGVGQDTISGIEKGRHEPRPSTLRKLADALGVEVADFFREPALPKAEAPRGAGRFEGSQLAGLSFKAAYWLETLERNADVYEDVLQSGTYSLDLIWKTEYAVTELVGLYSQHHRRELQEVASDGQWQKLEAAKRRLRSLRTELREASRKKFEEERDRLDPGKVVEIRQKRAEMDRLVEQEERDVS
jgi:transcriptional regulator with XRE-family HTH domain